MTTKNPPDAVAQKDMTIFEAMTAIVKDLGPIAKDKRNTEQNYQFRGIDAAMDALNPLLAKYWVFPTIADIETRVFEPVVSRNGAKGFHLINKYTFEFFAKDGSSVTTKMEGEAIDYGDKAVTKAQSVAYREALYKTFCAPFTASVDIEDDSHDLKPENEKKDPPPPKPATPAAQRPAPAARPAQPPKKPEVQRLATPYGIKKNRQVWEDYWIIKMGVRGNEKNEDGTPKNTMENMWSTFDEEIKLIFGKDKIEELTINESIKLEDINRRKLADIIAEESRMRIEQTPGHTSGSQKMVHNQPATWKTPSQTKASASTK